MLNHTYTSVKNANIVDCGKKEKIPSQPFPLLRDNYLGEYRTELDKKKVLANLGIATELSLVWENIKGNIGDNADLMRELDVRTKYVTQIGEFKDKVITIIDGIKYLESIVGGEQEGEEEQNERLAALEKDYKKLDGELSNLKTYLEETIEIDIDALDARLTSVEGIVNNITSLIQVSSKAGNALRLLNSEQVGEGETPGLYVQDLSTEVSTATSNITTLQGTVDEILDNYVTKDDLGGDGSFDFVNNTDFSAHVAAVNGTLQNIQTDLNNTVKTNSEGHVTNLKVNQISNNTNKENVITITDSFEMTAGVPLDIRFVVPTRSDLAKLKASVCYAGMGVIVKNESSLYILREPQDGKLTQEFIEDIEINWKCPEDLVTQALTREQYEELLQVDPETGKNKINPHNFYYIFEEDTEEPKRSDFTSDESYQEAYNAWLKILSQEYMSAAWGVEIETKVAEKADNLQVTKLGTLVSGLQDQIDLIKGGDSSTSVLNLANRVTNTEKDLEYLLGKDKNDESDEGSEEGSNEKGKIAEIEESISTLASNVDSTYVSKADITEVDEDNNTDYIFVKKDDYNSDKTNHENAIATEVVTQKLTTNKISLQYDDEETPANITLTSDGSDLFINDQEVALVKEVPVIEMTSQTKYESDLAKGNIQEHVYYYITDDIDRYILASEFNSYKTSQDFIINTLSTQLGDLSQIIKPNQENSQTLVQIIQDLALRVSELETKLAGL